MTGKYSSYTPKKYSDLDFTPPDEVARNAKLGLQLRKRHGKGGGSVSFARARDLSNKKSLSPATIRRMVNHFQLHNYDEIEKDEEHPEGPSRAYILHLLHGGDEGKRWCQSVYNDMCDCSESLKSSSDELIERIEESIG